MPSSAPSTPNGTPNSTANGIDQLSYCAASTRNTMTRPSAKTRPAWPVAARSWNDCPEYPMPTPWGANCSDDQLIDLLHHLTRAAALLGRAGEQRRAEAVEPEHLGRPAAELGVRTSADTGIISLLRPADVEPCDVLRRLAELRLRLRLHAVGPAVQVEVVDVERREERLQGAEQIGEVDPARLGGGPVHVEIHLRHVGPEVRGHAPAPRAADSPPPGTPARSARSRGCPGRSGSAG